MIPSAGFDAASSTVSLRSRITSETARMIASRRAVRRYGFGMTGLAAVLPPPKFIPDPFVPVSCLAPLLAGALLLLPSLIRLLCVSSPLPCPNAEAAPIETSSVAKKTVRYFIREFLKTNRETGDDRLRIEHLIIKYKHAVGMWSPIMRDCHMSKRNRGQACDSAIR